jgi:RNA polymerase sigma-70 factor (ECF subfamily)
MTEPPPIFTLITEHQRPIHAFILAMVPSGADADDILQDVNMVLMRKGDSFIPGSNFLAWACTVARYEVLNHYRDRKRARQVMVDEDFLICLADETAKRVEAQDERIAALRGCVGQLTERSRQLLQRFYGDDLSLRAIADERSQSEAALRVTLHRIRMRLMACIQQALAAGEAP